jgi:putative ABC transport system permease protein
VRSVPGVQDAAWSSALPLGDSLYGDFALTYEIVGEPVPKAQRPTTNYQVVSSSYFSTIDLPIVEGRAFDSRDTRTSPRVCIVNEAFVRTLNGRSPIGMQVAFYVADSPQDKPNVGEIVGVAKQVKGRPDEAKDVPMAHDLIDDTILTVRAKTGKADALAPAVRAAISRIDTAQLVSVRDVTTLEDIEWAATGRHRFRAVMVGAFATLAVALAMVGVFGVLAYTVQQRVRDFGVRRALGASTGDVVRLVVASAFRVVAVGAAIGLAIAAMSGRLLGTVLYGVKPLDLTTFAAVTLLVAITAVLSIAAPTWRATRIDPAEALRGK